MINYYTINKIKNIYTHLNKRVKKNLLEVLKISEEKNVKFGEPYHYGSQFIISGGYYRKRYTIHIKKRLLRSNKFILELKYKKYSFLKKEFKLNDKEHMVNIIKEFLDNDLQSVPDKSEMIEEIKSYKTYEERWNGYACNTIDPISVDNALEYYEKLCEYFPYYEVLPSPKADTNNEYRMPEDSNSYVMIELNNNEDLYNKKRIEITFYRDEISVWGYAQHWDGVKYDYDYIYNFPTPVKDESVQIYKFEDLVTHLYWLDPKIQSIVREKNIDEIIG